ncbi:MAG: hypothetical protein NVSMB60_30220 [Mycobacterium sp.]
MSPRQRPEPHPPPAAIARDLGWKRPKGSIRNWSWQLLCEIAAEKYEQNKATTKTTDTTGTP